MVTYKLIKNIKTVALDIVIIASRCTNTMLAYNYDFVICTWSK